MLSDKIYSWPKLVSKDFTMAETFKTIHLKQCYIDISSTHLLFKMFIFR